MDDNPDAGELRVAGAAVSLFGDRFYLVALPWLVR